MTTGKQPKVLVAEDDPLIAMSLSQMLSRFGLEVVGVAAAVSDALRIAQTTRPDLAIFDVRLRGNCDGIEGAVLLRSFLDIPVVFLTGLSDEGTRARALALKPVA
jgi:DNA-binding response OmpR family regulator